MVKNRAYWEKRAENRMIQYQRLADDAANDVVKAYIKATDYINNEIATVFRNFQTFSGLSEQEALKLLNHAQYQSFDEDIRAMINKISDPVKKQEFVNMVSAPAYRFRMKRLEELQKNIDTTTNKLAEFEQSTTKTHYIDTAYEAYNRTIFDIQKGVGLKFTFEKMPQRRVEQILRNNWSGKLFSTRIWGNSADLNSKLKKELLTGFISGRPYHKTAAAIQEKMSTGAMEARRLVRTESTYIANMAELDSYTECGIKEYQFLATLDTHTSEICREHDGKKYLVSEGIPGETLPPLHPWCRSTTIAVIGSAELERLERRARDPETGKSYLIPANMTYKQWEAA